MSRSSRATQLYSDPVVERFGSRVETSVQVCAEYIVVSRQTTDILNEPVVYASCADSEVNTKCEKNEIDEEETRRD